MHVINYDGKWLTECTDFWWSLYSWKPYVVRPDGYEHPNVASTCPETFVRQLDDAFSRRSLSHWCGEVTPESIFLAKTKAGVAGIMITATNRDEATGYIRSGFMPCDATGTRAAALLLDETLDYLRKRGVRNAILGPTWALEIESPLHIAALNAGFVCGDRWARTLEPDDVGMRFDTGYEIYMGGNLQGFTVPPEIKMQAASLSVEGITFRCCTLAEAKGLRRLDNGEPPDLEPQLEFVFVALAKNRMVGWTGKTPCRDQPEVMASPGGADGLFVIPSYRRRGIGKVLFHLATEEIVRRGATHGFGGAGIYDPLRLIMKSVGYQYWYAAFPEMMKELKHGTRRTEE